MELTPSALAGAYQNFNTLFFQGYQSAQPWSGEVAMEIPSNTRENVMGWMQQLPGVRKWVGDRKIHALGKETYTLRNDDWEDSVGVSRHDFEDDLLGIYAPIFQQMGEQYAKHPDRQLASLLINGKTNLCFDGKAFFATDHPVDKYGGASGTFSNLKTSSALSLANYNTNRAAFQVIAGPNGEVMGNLPDTLIVPPALEQAAREIAEAPIAIQVYGSNTAAAAKPNVLAGSARVIVVPELSADSDTTWYLAKCKGAIKPLIHQIRQAVRMVMRNSPTDDNVFNTKQYQYGTDSREAFGYSFPFLMFRCEA
jgi:phage major head subunit gpT-like protein